MTEADETITVDSSDGSLRLDRWFKRHYPGLGHGQLEKLLRTGRIRVDGKRARSSDRIGPGQAIRIPPHELALPPRPVRPQPRPADEAMLQSAILHRDEAVIVLDKPPGLAVQGGTATERHVDGLLDGLRFGNPERPRLVHRLDKETSGILVIARTAAAAAFLTRAFREKTTRKIYWAVVVGRPKLAQGRIDLPLAKMAGHGGERVRPDTEEGRRAVTYYQVIDSAGTQASWLGFDAGYRTHPPAARPLRRDRHADPRRLQIRRGGGPSGGRSRIAPAPLACTKPVHAASARRAIAGDGAASAAYAAELGIFRLCG